MTNIVCESVWLVARGKGDLSMWQSRQSMLLGVEICRGVDEGGDIFARAADHGIAMVAQQRAHLARLVIVVHHQLFNRYATDGTAALLAGKHRLVLLQRDAIAY